MRAQSSDREDFEKILQEKSKGVRGMMRAMFQSGEHTEASSGGGHFNPFKSTGSNSKDEHHSSKLPTIVLNNNSSHGSVETGTLGQ
jgi:Cu/Zn superoxide dismutase